jgi:hypothetical protein
VRGLAIRLLLLLTFAAICVLTLIGLFPSSIPRTSNPTYLDVIFGSRLVVFATRLVVFSAALVLLLGSTYVAASMVVRIKRGQWLRRAGPFESELAGTEDALDRNVDSLVGNLRDAWHRIEELGQELERCGDDLDTAYAEVERMSAEVLKLKQSDA